METSKIETMDPKENNLEIVMDCVKSVTEDSNTDYSNLISNTIPAAEVKPMDLDPPVLENQVDFKYHKDLHNEVNEDLPMPELELVAISIPNNSMMEEGDKTLYVKLLKQKLAPRKLIVNINKLKDIEAFCSNIEKETFKFSIGKDCNTKKYGKILHESKIFQCDYCTIIMTKRSLLQNHRCDHKEKEIIQCHTCPEMFKTVDQLKKHFCQKINKLRKN